MPGLSPEYMIKTFLQVFVNLLALLWPMWVLIGIVLLIRLVFFLFERQRLKKSGIRDIDYMDGLSFEKRLQLLFKNLGYKVERTQYTGDYGGDLVLSKEGLRTVVQAKRYRDQVGLKAVQEAVAAKGYYNCHQAMVITNSYFTKQAIQLAKSNNVILWDRKELIKALVHSSDASPSYETSEEDLPLDIDHCAFCGGPVSDKVKKFCLAHPERFRGRVYCYDHQK